MSDWSGSGWTNRLLYRAALGCRPSCRKSSLRVTVVADVLTRGGEVAYLGITEDADPIRRVVNETQISQVFHTGRRSRVLDDIGTPITGGNCFNLDLVSYADRQQPHQLPAANIGDERDPGEAQQARRVGRGQSSAIEFLLDEVEIMIRRLRCGHFVRFRVLPLTGRTKKRCDPGDRPTLHRPGSNIDFMAAFPSCAVETMREASIPGKTRAIRRWPSFSV
jgi:hypothetical protein